MRGDWIRLDMRGVGSPFVLLRVSDLPLKQHLHQCVRDAVEYAAQITERDHGQQEPVARRRNERPHRVDHVREPLYDKRRHQHGERLGHVRSAVVRLLVLLTVGAELGEVLCWPPDGEPDERVGDADHHEDGQQDDGVDGVHDAALLPTHVRVTPAKTRG